MGILCSDKLIEYLQRLCALLGSSSTSVRCASCRALANLLEATEATNVSDTAQYREVVRGMRFKYV